MHWSLLTTDFDAIEAYLNDGTRITNQMRDIWLIQLMENHKRQQEEGYEVVPLGRSSISEKLRAIFKRAS